MRKCETSPIATIMQATYGIIQPVLVTTLRMV